MSASASLLALLVSTAHGALWPSKQSSSPRSTVLAPGLVLIRNAISEAEQKELAAKTQRLGERSSNGFRGADGTLNAGARGRIYERCSRLPSSFARFCSRCVGAAQEADASMPSCRPSHCLINYYTSASGLKWHRDIYKNDGDGDQPIINLSVGASCVFGLQDQTGRTHKVLLRSGDALLFGGPSRFIRHAVLKVKLHDRPQWMAADDAPYRLSFTFRAAQSVIGQEHYYRLFSVHRRWFERTQRAWREGDPLVPAVP